LSEFLAFSSAFQRKNPGVYLMIFCIYKKATFPL